MEHIQRLFGIQLKEHIQSNVQLRSNQQLSSKLVRIQCIVLLRILFRIFLKECTQFLIHQ